MVQYVIRVQVIEVARKEGIAEIETVREIPEQVILSIDSDAKWLNLGNAITSAQKVINFMRKQFGPLV